MGAAMTALPQGFVREAPAGAGRPPPAKDEAQRLKTLRNRHDARIVDAVVALASQGGREDARRLHALEAQIGKEAFRRLGGFVLQKLGARGDAFSAQAFVARYEQLSEVGRNKLFGAAGTPTRRALDDLVAATKHVGHARARRAGQGRAAANGEGAAPVEPLTALRQAALSAGAGLTAAAIVSRPATARAVSRWTRAWDKAAAQRTRGTRNALFATARQLASAVTREFGVKVNAARLTAVRPASRDP
jgi:hypothetical protein